MQNEINYEGLIKDLELCKNFALLLNSSSGQFSITNRDNTILGEVILPSSMEEELKEMIRAFLMSELKKLKIYTFGE